MYGRVATGPRDKSDHTFYVDSLSLDRRRPFAYQTFMSADTIYYRSDTGQNVIDRDGSDGLGEMLKCLFDGPALRVRAGGSGRPDSVEHFNESCRSGEYSHINTPVTLAAFFFGSPGPGAGGTADRWSENRVAPSFSGTGFHPTIRWLYRVVDSRDKTDRITITADTTLQDVSFIMNNGERATIVIDRFRVGGTLSIEDGRSLPLWGELRIREELTLLRHNAGGQIIDKLGDYTIRFRLIP
jgi:hypothetical protein